MKITQSVKLINDPSFAFEACFSCDIHIERSLMKGRKEGMLRCLCRHFIREENR